MTGQGPGKEVAAVPPSVHHIDLRKIHLLAELTDSEMVRVKADLRLRQVARRETVLQKGGEGDGLLFLFNGQLQVNDITEDGRTVGLRMLSEGDFFGEIAVINGTTRSASVVAVTKALVGLLPTATSLHLFSHCPSVAKLMLRHLATKIQRDSEIRGLLSIHNTSKRIYTFLALKAEQGLGGEQVVENLPAHQDIANMINTSRETVTRALRHLIEQGIAEKQMHRLIIRDPRALHQLAHYDV
jgi:CRP-like cAMP-binding protein